MADSKLADLTATTSPADTDILYIVTDPAGTPADKKVTVANLRGASATASPATCQGRLTLTTATPITTSDVTAATTVYFTPYQGSRVATYDGSAWSESAFTEKSLSLAGLAADTNHDIFIVDSTLALEAVAWTNDTTRATALVLQDGVYVKSGATTRRYLGTIRTTATIGQCEDSAAKRFVWNNVNRKRRPMRVVDTTDNWSYVTSAWRAANNSTANRVSYVAGLSEDAVKASVVVLCGAGSGNAGAVGIAVDATNTNHAQVFNEALTDANPLATAAYDGYPGLGFHFLQWVEYRRAGTIQFKGDDGIADQQSGMVAEVFA